MADLTFKDLEDCQARALLRLVGMMKAADKRNEKVIKENGDVINLGKIPMYPETVRNVEGARKLSIMTKCAEGALSLFLGRGKRNVRRNA
jgi:hypothetical protein